MTMYIKDYSLRCAVSGGMQSTISDVSGKQQHKPEDRLPQNVAIDGQSFRYGGGAEGGTTMQLDGTLCLAG